MRSAIPLLAVIKSVSSGLKYHKHKLLRFKATLHKDNRGALILTNLESGCHTPISKFYAIKLHWYRSWLKPSAIEVIFSYPRTKIDYLTKHFLLYRFKVIGHCLWDDNCTLCFCFSLKLSTFVQEGESMYSNVCLYYMCIC